MTRHADDDGVDSDFIWFRKRPDVRTRIRLPFRDELPPLLAPAPHGATILVIVTVNRRDDGSFLRARGFLYAPAGHA